ncbi:MAG: glycosyltransferase family 4 protein [Alphaproteobacteria bacterium]|nr:glycosyltransferase family 4 protein [Alphaproteobacteria bacterium]
MKLLYCHDNVYFQSELGTVYSQGQFPYSYYEPYIRAFSDVTILGRGAILNKNHDLQKLNVSSGPEVDFELMPNINSICGLLKNRKNVDRALKKLVAESDAVVIRAVSDLGWLAYKHARAMKKPIAMEMSACAWDSTWNHGSPYGKIYAPIRYLRDKVITAHADYVLYVSQNFLQGRYKTHGHTAVASNVRIPAPDPQILEKRLQSIEAAEDNEMLVIGLIGTLGNKLKGIHIAFEALRRIENNNPGRFVFKILGPGRPEKYRALARSMGVDHLVSFEGVIQSGAGVLDWLKDIDLYIQPSFQEGVPRATIEAMSMGCPVLGSTAGGIPELLSPDCLHKPGDATTLWRGIDKMLSNKEWRKQEAIRNFEKSKFYTSERLMPVRYEFWKSFANFAAARKSAPEETPLLKHAV